MASQIGWPLTGDYFGNCGCAGVCPCFLSSGRFLSAKPTHGFCEVAMVFHIERGCYGDLSLDGLNAIVMARTPWSDERGQLVDGAVRG
jgi:hypothetical protein